MKTISEHIREHLLVSLGVYPNLDLKALLQTEWDKDFERYMRNRLIMGALRYGPMHIKSTETANLVIDMARDRLEMYASTRNAELLVDVANLCMVAFVKDQHPKRHFRAIDRR